MKLDALVADMLSERRIDAAAKFVVVSEDETIRGFFSSCKLSGMRVIVCDNSHSNKLTAHHQIQQFEDGAADVFVVSRKATQLGINLQVAKVMYFVDNDFSVYGDEQSKARVGRQGCTFSEVHIRRLVTVGTISADVSKFHQRWTRQTLMCSRRRRSRAGTIGRR